LTSWTGRLLAATDAGTALTERHRRELLRLRASTLREVVKLWPLLDLSDVDGTSGRWFDAAAPAVVRGRNEAVGEAATYINRFAIAETGIPLESATFAAPVGTTQLRSRLLGAGPWTFKQKIGQGRTVRESQAEALIRLSGEVTRTVLDGSRETVLATAADRNYRWQRITDGDPCAFCAMLAVRGAVYQTQMSGGFQAHRSCACSAEPVMRNSGTGTPEAEKWRGIYAEATAGDVRDGTSNPLLNAFRRAYEAQRP